jgi:hypothetical protein
VKSAWTIASAIALFGTYIYTIWPEVEGWIWRFDKYVKTLITGMPRVFALKAYAVREEALKVYDLWESDAEKAHSLTQMVSSGRTCNGNRTGDKAWLSIGRVLRY